MNKQKLTLALLTFTILAGCESSSPSPVTELPADNGSPVVVTPEEMAPEIVTAKEQNDISTDSLPVEISCEPLKYHCHSQRKAPALSKETDKNLSAALNIADRGFAISAARRLESVKAKNDYEQAILHYHLANLNTEIMGKNAVALDYILKAIDSGNLPAEEYKSALYLEIMLLVELGWFDMSEEKALQYFAYIDEPFDMDIFELFEQIAQLKRDQKRHDLLLEIQTMFDEQEQRQAAQEVLDEIQSRVNKNRLTHSQVKLQINKTRKLKDNSTCRVMTYQCHRQRAQKSPSGPVQKALKKAQKLLKDKSFMEAKNLLESIQPSSDFDAAMVNRLLAYLYSDAKLHELSLNHARTALSGYILNAEDHRYLMRLEIVELYYFGEFEQAKQKLEQHLNYDESTSDTYMEGLLLRIAKLQNNRQVLRTLQNQALQSPERAEILYMYQVFSHFGDIQERTQTTQASNDSKPKVIYQKEYAYPMEAAKEGITGSIILKFDLNTQGEPINIRVMNATPKGYFEEAGIKALEQWRYKVELDDAGNVIGGNDLEVHFTWNIGRSQ
ncbi:hypothetical protein JF50_02875 [Pseudoalteromonas luteoviolacea]|uniref:TonB C-terminal domain-containing protein n=1 Tax=Pseudoalteromonas luteoviolacea TaxID=43657 RepID=A0A0C1QHG6_9GAMM|nr:energy transducer TonB [Pseudoalteromonas luteoviolacea]KID58815.1 hypothetical protein JF50_02875 [Pseudoalteromonas luteoviolacea]